jgi:AraC-like DNA-binding protein
MSSADHYRFPMQVAGIALRAAPAIGLDGPRLLAQAGLTISDLSDPDRYLTLRQLVTLARISRAANRTGLPLAVVSTRCVRFSHLGMLGVAMVSADDLFRTVEIGVRFGGNFIPGLTLWLEREQDAASVHMRFDDALSEIVDVMTESIVFGCRQLAMHFEDTVHLRRVEFAHAAAHPSFVYEELLGCPVEFGADQTRIELVPHADRVRSSCANPTTFEHASRHLRAQQALRPAHSSWSDRVRELWLSCAEQGVFLSREQIAKRLALGPKTLARKLAAEGTGFRELMQDVRMQRALALVRDSELPPGEVGRRLGFQSEAAFYRAFRHWTATTPRTLRRAEPAPQAESAPKARATSAR